MADEIPNPRGIDKKTIAHDREQLEDKFEAKAYDAISTISIPVDPKLLEWHALSKMDEPALADPVFIQDRPHLTYPVALTAFGQRDASGARLREVDLGKAILILESAFWPIDPAQADRDPTMFQVDQLKAVRATQLLANALYQPGAVLNIAADATAARHTAEAVAYAFHQARYETLHGPGSPDKVR